MLLLMAPRICWLGRRCGRVIKSFRFLSDDTATDKTFKRSQLSLVFGCHETDGIANRLRTACAADTVDIIFRMHREVIIDDMGNTIDVDSARGNVRCDENAHGTGFEIFQCP